MLPVSIIIPTYHVGAEIVDVLASIPACLRNDIIIVNAETSPPPPIETFTPPVRLISAPQGRGMQLATGAQHSTSPWMLFLHADSRLKAGIEQRIHTALQCRDKAYYFRFLLHGSQHNIKKNILETMVALRCALLRLPYGDQGLLIHRSTYDACGGFAPIPLMEDVDMAWRLRRQLQNLGTGISTAADKFEKRGYFKNAIFNLSCLAQYIAGHPIEKIAQRYNKR